MHSYLYYVPNLVLPDYFSLMYGICVKKVKYIIETMKLIEEYALGQENLNPKDLLSFLLKNLARNETRKHIFCFKVTSTCESFEFTGPEHQGYSKNIIARSFYRMGSSNSTEITPKGKVTDIKKTITSIDLIVNRQLYIFLCTLLYIIVYRIANSFM